MVATKDPSYQTAISGKLSNEAKCLDFIAHAEQHPKYTHQRSRAALCEEFEQGKQWTEAQEARLKEVGVEPITINRCLTTIKALTGMYLDNLQDITVIPRKGGSESAAQVITEIMKHAQDQGGYETAAFQTFQQANISTAGYIYLDIDKSKTENGQIEFCSNNFFDVIVDPDCECYDLDNKEEGAKYVIRKIYMDREILKTLFDKDYDQSFVTDRSTMDQYIAEATIRSQFYTEEEKQYRSCLYECFWKEYKKAIILRDLETGETKLVTEKVEKRRRAASKSRRLEVEPTFQVVLHRTYLVNGREMEDQENPYGPEFTEYPLVRYVPIYRPDYERGILDDLTSINFEENIRRTQVVRLLNQTANAGWKVAKATDAKAKNELKQFGSVGGYIADESKFGGKLEKIEPTKLSEGHFLLAQQSSEDIKEVSGLNAALQGYDNGSKNEAGVVLNLRKEQGESANSSIFKNFRASLEILGNKMLRLINAMDIYTDTEIRAIVQESHLLDATMLKKAHEYFTANISGGTTLEEPQAPPQLSPEMWGMVSEERMPDVYDQIRAGVQGAEIYAQQYPMNKKYFDGAIRELAIEMLLEDLFSSEVTQYGIKVVASPKTETARLRAFEMMMAIQDKYGVIPVDILLEYSDLPNKDAIIARIQAQEQAQAQAAAAEQQAAQVQQIEGAA